MIRFECSLKGKVTNIECSECFSSSTKLKREFYSRVQCKVEHVNSSSIIRVNETLEKVGSTKELFAGE